MPSSRTLPLLLGVLVTLAGMTACGARKNKAFAEGPYSLAYAADYRFLVASRPRQIEQGLMFVKQIPAHQGMVFVLAPETPATFWMKNCPINMDMVFIARDGRIQQVLAAQAPRRGTPDRDLTIYTAQGTYTVQNALQLKLPATAFVVEVAAGEGPKFEAKWRPELVKCFTGLDQTPHLSFGF